MPVLSLHAEKLTNFYECIFESILTYTEYITMMAFLKLQDIYQAMQGQSKENHFSYLFTKRTVTGMNAETIRLISNLFLAHFIFIDC